MIKHVILDRDGVLNEKIENGYVLGLNQLKLIKDSFDFLRRISLPGIKFSIVTNQQAIGKGLLTHSQLNQIHESIRNRFIELNLPEPIFFVCPHLESSCNCRKPHVELIERAIKASFVPRADTLLVGDSITDIIPANKARIRSIHLDKSCKYAACTPYHSYDEFLLIEDI